MGCQSGGTRAVRKLKNHQLAAALIRCRVRKQKASKIDQRVGWVRSSTTHEKSTCCCWAPQNRSRAHCLFTPRGADSVCVYSLTRSLIGPRTNCLLNYGSFNKRLLQFAICLPTWKARGKGVSSSCAPRLHGCCCRRISVRLQLAMHTHTHIHMRRGEFVPGNCV